VGGDRERNESESGGESVSESDLDCTKWGKVKVIFIEFYTQEMSEWSKMNRNETHQGQGAEGM
jgi:hypothetical protein